MCFKQPSILPFAHLVVPYVSPAQKYFHDVCVRGQIKQCTLYLPEVVSVSVVEQALKKSNKWFRNRERKLKIVRKSKGKQADK